MFLRAVQHPKKSGGLLYKRQVWGKQGGIYKRQARMGKSGWAEYESVASSLWPLVLSGPKSIGCTFNPIQPGEEGEGLLVTNRLDVL